MDQEKKSEVCRVCLRCDANQLNKYLYLFEKNNDCLISEKINSIANVDICLGDGLPDKICPECLLDLENAINFKLKCVSSNIILRSNGVQNIDLNLDIKVEVEPQTDYIDTDFFDNEFSIEIKVPVESIEPDIKSQVTGLNFECHDCGNLFKSKCKLRVHWKKAHKHSQLICEKCKRQFKSYKAFHMHRKSKLQSCAIASGPLVHIEGIGKSRVLHCKECKYKTIHPKDMKSHLVLHTGDRPYSCELCNKRFTQLSSVHAHREAAHKEYKIEGPCQFCGKYIKGRNNLYKHLKLHTSPQVQCEVCKKVLKNIKYLQIHMKRHSATKHFSCEMCGSMFFTSSDLANHKRNTHNKEKKYECNICGYLARTSDIIKRHKLKHNATNVPCLLCGKFSASKEELTVHQKRHFERNHKCPHCELTFYNKKDLNKHVNRKHKLTMLVNKVTKPVRVKQEIPSNIQYEKAISLSPKNLGE